MSMATDVIGRLADKSLLERGGDGRVTRWRMLDTVRAYAREQLTASNDRLTTEEAHLLWATSAAVALEEMLVEDEAWIEQFDAVADGLRAAFARLLGSNLARERFALGLSLGHLAYARGLLTEAHGHFVSATECTPDPADAVVALRGAASVARAHQRLSLDVEQLHRAASAAQACGLPAAAARSLADIAREEGRFPSGLDVAPDHDATLTLIERARSLDPGDDRALRVAISLAAAWNGRPRPTEPDPTLANAALVLARDLGDPLLLSEALDAVSSAASFAGRRREAARVTSERLELIDQMPRHSPDVGLEVFDVHHAATETAVAAGDLTAALAAGRRAQTEALDAALPYLAASRVTLPLALLGSFDEALVQANLMRDSWVRVGRPTAGWMANAVYAAALVHGLRGNTAAFDEWWDMAAELSARSSTNEMRTFVTLRIALHHGRLDGTILEPAVGSLGDYTRCLGIEVAVVTGAVDAEVQISAAASLGDENAYAAAMLRRASGRLHHDPTELEAAVSMWESIGACFERACTLALIPGRRREGERRLTDLGCPSPAARHQYPVDLHAGPGDE